MSSADRLGLFYTIVRPEERAIVQAAERRGVPLERLSDDALAFGLEPPDWPVDVVLNRSVSHTRAVYAARFFESYGLPCVNPAAVLERAGDKVVASLALARAGVPTPKTVVALTEEAAWKALEAVGYPAVLKPPIGSWGRLMAKVDNPEAAEQILEHKGALGSPIHSVFYVQEFVPKPDRDLRVLLVGDRIVGAMARRSASWRTNAARGATVEPWPVDDGLARLARDAARAMGGGVLAVDVMESPRGRLVHEVNPTPEFKALQGTTDVDIADLIVEHALERGAR